MTAYPPPPPEAADPQTPPPAPPASGWSSAVAADLPPEPTAGPAPGLAYATALRRLGAYLIDVVLLGICVGLVAGSAVFALVLVPLALDAAALSDVARSVEIVSGYVGLDLVLVAAVGLYFASTWRWMRGTVGQRMLGMYVANEADGAPLSWSMAVARWFLLTLGPFPALAAWVLPAGLADLGTVVWLVWSLVLLVTTATSATHQGLHDRWVRCLVVRRP